MHLVHLFELAYPFQIEVFFPGPPPLPVLVHCLYDAFIASKLCSTRVGFQFWEQTVVRRGHIRRMGRGGGVLRIRIHFRLFIVTDYLSDAPRRRLVVTGDSARIQDETTENSAWFFNLLGS